MKREDWIKVTDRLPKNGECVLTYAHLFASNYAIFEGYYDGEHWSVKNAPDYYLVGVTHWMPIVLPNED